jgi:3-deoxy-manno-octulosonate cytidylyltransferase (CMP-KDO synthetase)
MKTTCIIPARLESQRLDKKLLLDVNGKSVLQRTYEQVAKVEEVDEIIVATDSEEILKHVEAFGGVAKITSKDHKTGTDRIVEVANELDSEIIVNVQGDEPLINPEYISKCVRELIDDVNVAMTTLVAKIDPKRAEDPNIVKIVFNKDMYGLYMSRHPIPYQRNEGPMYMHIGVYAYRRPLLLDFAQLEQTWLAGTESTEIMRLVENGINFKCVEVDKEPRSVDTPEDLEEVRKAVKN